MAALVVAAVLLAIAASIYSGVPIENVTGVMLLPLALGGSAVTTLLLPPRPRPVRVAWAGHQTPAPGRATHTVRVGGARCGQGMPRPGQRPAQPMRASSPGRDINSQPVDSRLGGRPAAATPEGEAAAAGPTSSGARPTRSAGRAPGSHPNENARRLRPAGGKGSSR